MDLKTFKRLSAFNLFFSRNVNKIGLLFAFILFLINVLVFYKYAANKETTVLHTPPPPPIPPFNIDKILKFEIIPHDNSFVIAEELHRKVTAKNKRKNVSAEVRQNTHHKDSHYAQIVQGNNRKTFILKNPPGFKPSTDLSPFQCLVLYPKNEDLYFHNVYWQVLHYNTTNFYLYGAYYDDRESKKMSNKVPFVHILGLVDKMEVATKSEPLFCQMWFEKLSMPKLVAVKKSHLLWPPYWGLYRDGIPLPRLFSCPIYLKKEEKGMIPFAVSLTNERCKKSTNKLPVVHGKKKGLKKTEFGVCVKGLDFAFEDISFRLIEWIELIFKLGGSKIYFYELAVEANTKKVLDYYEAQGKIITTPLLLPGITPNDPILRHKYLKKHTVRKRQMELIPYNDCFHRFRESHKYITLLDIDEIIVPKKVSGWKELISSQPKQINIVNSYNIYQDGCFFTGVDRPWAVQIPSFMHMLRHIHKITPTQPQTERGKKTGAKGFYSTRNVLNTLNHLPKDCLFGSCFYKYINSTDASLFHYKDISYHCANLSYKCNSFNCLKYKTDKTLWKYKEYIIPRVEKVIKELQLKV